MNKILIALVLAVVMSGNAYADETNKLFYVCNDKANKQAETWVINKSSNEATRRYIRTTGESYSVGYNLIIKDYLIEIRNGVKTYYTLDRKTLEISISDYLSGMMKYPAYKFRADPKFCKVSSKEDTNEFHKKISAARKLKYEESIKY